MAGILLEGENVGEEKRAAFARELAERMRPLAMQKMADAQKQDGGRRLAAALSIP